MKLRIQKSKGEKEERIKQLLHESASSPGRGELKKILNETELGWVAQQRTER